MEQFHRWMEGRRRQISMASNEVALSDVSIVLDIAASDGELSELVRNQLGGRLITLDSDLASCAKAAAAGRETVRGDVRHLPFAAGVADVTVAFEIVEHLYANDATRMIHELHRVTKPGGKLLLSTPNRLSLESWKGLLGYIRHGSIWNARDDTHIRLLTPGGVRHLLKPYFRIDKCFGYSLFPTIHNRSTPVTYAVTSSRLLVKLSFIMLVVATRTTPAA